MKAKNDNKTLLILDIDETLIYATKQALDQEVAFQIYDYYVYERPYLADFLDSIKDDFILAIWSSASDDYVEAVVQQIIPKDIDLAFVWGRSRCVYRRNLKLDEYGYYDDNIRNHYHFIKPLKKVKRLGYKLERILIVDDTPHKSQDNYGNAIYPKVYTGDEEDEELLLLGKYLHSLKDKPNVRGIEKRNWREQVT